MNYRYLWIAIAAALLAGCGTPAGRPQPGAAVSAPSEVSDFRVLFGENCAACHGVDGRGGAAIALADPVYLAVVDDASLRKAIADGVRGASMPSFAARAGGMLTDRQIDIIATQIRSRWGRPGILDGANPPSYAATSAGDAVYGQAVYRSYCESCHGPDGAGGPKGSAITNDSYLALVSDQGLRTIVIAGRPELGAPDWRGNLHGHPITDQEVTDVVAWLGSHRTQTPGQPYSSMNLPQRKEP